MFSIVHDGMNVFNFSSIFSNCLTTFCAREEEDQGTGNPWQGWPSHGRWAEAFYLSKPTSLLRACYINTKHSAGSEAAC